MRITVSVNAARERDDYRIFNRNIKITSVQIKAMLAKADLENRGFTKEVTTRIITRKDLTTEIVTEYFIYKTVPCNQFSLVQLQLASLLPGVWGNDFTNRTRQIVKKKSLTPVQQCLVGIEIHFPQTGCQNTKPSKLGDESLYETKRTGRTANNPSAGNAGCGYWCLICLRATTLD